MKLIVALGNPGQEYEHTRHNAGFLAFGSEAFISGYLLRYGGFAKHIKFQAELLKTDAAILAKPLAFMNRSGDAVRALLDFYKIAPKDLLVIHDDVDLPLGIWRAAFGSSSAGHKGVQSVIEALGTADFHRLRLGVESRADKKNPPTEAYVLQDFTLEEREKLQPVLEQTVAEIGKFIGK